MMDKQDQECLFNWFANVAVMIGAIAQGDYNRYEIEAACVHIAKHASEKSMELRKK